MNTLSFSRAFFTIIAVAIWILSLTLATLAVVISAHTIGGWGLLGAWCWGLSVFAVLFSVTAYLAISNTKRTNSIVIKKRSDDFHASLVGHPEIWGHGKTSDDAIGDLIRSHSETFNIFIK